MLKLPKIKWIKYPSTDKLAFWLAIRSADVESRGFEVWGKAANNWSEQPAGAGPELICGYDGNIAVGDIRLLSPRLTPTVNRPVYIAVFRNWEPDGFLIAPYSPYSLAATSTELEFPDRCHPLRVACTWNTRSVHPRSVSDSWLIDKLSKEEEADIWHSFRHSAVGHPIPESLEGRVGGPIRRPDDPRIAYQCEEADVLHVIDDMEHLANLSDRC